MTVLKYLIKPMELIIFLSMIAALVYFRSIIFQPNINQYITAGLSYIEDTFDIAIPSHQKQAEEITVGIKDECDSGESNVVVAEENPVVENVENNIKDSFDASPQSKDIEVVSESDVNASEGSSLIEVPSETKTSANEQVDILVEADNKPTPVLEEDSAKVDDSIPDSSIKGGSVDTEEKAAVASSMTSEIPEIKQVLMMARQSFWSGNMYDSERLYLDLIKINDSEPDVYGELGNVYYSQGKWKQAGKAYFEAAIRILALKQDDQSRNRVSYLLRVIQGLDAESAEKLKNKISG